MRYATAAIELFKKAIKYWPFDQHDYRGLLKSLLLERKTDNLSDWRMPEPLQHRKVEPTDIQQEFSSR